ncbi:MAG: ATP-binding protein [Myxococcota bacterium]|jgi:ATP-dependent 26S proteasome regulatory subunit|nr:ATP-binding protein [Myxococcota bacterium]
MLETSDNTGLQPDEPFAAYCQQALELVRWQLQSQLGPDYDLHLDISQGRERLAETIERLHQQGGTTPETRLASLFALSPVEQMSLWLAALPWIDASTRPLIANVAGHPWVSLQLCMNVFAANDNDRRTLWNCTQATSPWQRFGLVRLLPRGFDPNPLRHEIAPSTDLLGIFQGLRVLDGELDQLAYRSTPTLQRSDLSLHTQGLHDTLFTLVHNFWAQLTEPKEKIKLGGFAHPSGLALLLQGPEGVGKTSLLKALGHSLGVNLIIVEGEHFKGMPRAEAKRCILAMLRESALYSELLIVRHAEALVEKDRPYAAMLADGLMHIPAAIALCTKEMQPIHRSLEPCLSWRERLRAPKKQAEIRKLWQSHFQAHYGEDAEQPDFELLQSRYALEPLRIGRAVRSALMIQRSHHCELDRAARQQLPDTLGELARAEPAERRLHELVLAPELNERIIDIIEAARNRDRVLFEWKLAQSVRSGRGLCCLFSGEPGTGKSLCAEVIACELQLQLFRINTSQLFDKYIGETEKNLERVFQTARPSTHLLLFDEADALFSKRTQVRSSNDRYSNLNVGVLLQLVESYDGVVVLTTNLKHNIDRAFERRIMFKLVFPLPQAPERERIWRLLLPEGQVPTAEHIDYEALAELEVSGGEIKNAVMHAAYDAARQGKLLDNQVLMEAAYRSVSESGRLIREGE